MRKIYFQFKGPETTHPEIVIITLGIIGSIGVIILIGVGLIYAHSDIYLFEIGSLIVICMVIFLIIVDYLLESRYIKEKYGEKEPRTDRIQIYVYEDEIVYVKKLIHGKENRKVIRAENTVDIKVTPTLLIYKPRDYRSIAKEFEITMYLDEYEKRRLWITLDLPKISRKDKKKLKAAIEDFKMRNKLGKYSTES